MALPSLIDSDIVTLDGSVATSVASKSFTAQAGDLFVLSTPLCYQADSITALAGANVTDSLNGAAYALRAISPYYIGGSDRSSAAVWACEASQAGAVVVTFNPPGTESYADNVVITQWRGGTFVFAGEASEEDESPPLAVDLTSLPSGDYLAVGVAAVEAAAIAALTSDGDDLVNAVDDGYAEVNSYQTAEAATSIGLLWTDTGLSGFDKSGVAAAAWRMVVVPEIDSVTPDTFADGATGVVIDGSGFSATGNTVLISPVDDPDGETSVAASFVANADGGANPTTGTTITVPTVPTGAQMLVAFTSRDHTAGTAQPTVTDNDGGTWVQKDWSTDRKAQLWHRRATSATTGKTITIAGCVGSCAAVLHVVADPYETGDPITNLTQESNTSGNETHAAITPSNAGSYLVGIVFNYANDNAVTSMSTGTAGALANFNEHLSTGGNDCAVALAGLANVAASGTGAFTWAQTNGTTYSMLLAIRSRTPLGAAVEQTITAEDDEQITFTVVKDTLALGPAFLFVVNDDDVANASGFPVTLTAVGGGFQAAWARQSNVIIGMIP